MEVNEASWQYLRKNFCAPNLDELSIPQEARKAFALAMFDYIAGDAHGFWSEPDSGDGHCDPNHFVISVASRLSALCALYNGNVIQSPIEAQLGSAMLWMDCDWAGFPSVDEADLFERNICAGPGSVNFLITPQAKIGKYTVDFLLWFSCNGKRSGIVIECDGHNFHERTKEQAAHDKRRDRELLLAGYPVMRFTGSEIFKDVTACVAQIFEQAVDVLFRVSKDGGFIP